MTKTLNRRGKAAEVFQPFSTGRRMVALVATIVAIIFSMIVAATQASAVAPTIHASLTHPTAYTENASHQSAAAPTVHPMAVAGCGGGRCTVYFSKSETRAIGNAHIPAPPRGLPWQITAAYYAFALAHVWFAQQYANRGWCSGFRLSIYPWGSQGYFGYACNCQRSRNPDPLSGREN